MSSLVVVGAQWGDEGKGKIVDLLTEEHDVVVRYQGGANAGHTVVAGDQTHLYILGITIAHPSIHSACSRSNLTAASARRSLIVVPACAAAVLLGLVADEAIRLDRTDFKAALPGHAPHQSLKKTKTKHKPQP